MAAKGEKTWGGVLYLVILKHGPPDFLDYSIQRLWLLFMLARFLKTVLQEYLGHKMESHCSTPFIFSVYGHGLVEVNRNVDCRPGPFPPSFMKMLSCPAEQRDRFFCRSQWVGLNILYISASDLSCKHREVVDRGSRITRYSLNTLPA